MNRSLKLSALIALALASSQAMALDLGQIQVKSALDRPLVAEIPLHPDHPGEADHLTVTLAPAAAFASAGISRADLKVPLTFAVVTHADGQKFIRVTSTQPVREPYLDFLIQVTWPKGKILREYTVLLDPLSAGSTFSSSTPATTSAQTVPAKPAPSKPAPSKPAPAKPAPAKPAAPVAAPAASKPQAPSAAPKPTASIYGPVKHGDTLSSIARANAINGVGYMQMLMALKTANPDAFFQNNVNALKAGAILRIPSREEAVAVTRRAAIAAVRQQNQTWQSQHAKAPTLVASSGGSSAPITGAGSGAGGGDHLALVPPEGKSSGATAGGTASASQLRQELARSQEALSSQKQAAADLTSRVSALEQLQGKNKRLLNLKNAEIAELKDTLSEARKSAGLPALPASAAQAAVAPASSSGLAAGTLPTAATSAGGAHMATAASTTVAAAPHAAQQKTVKPTAAATHPTSAATAQAEAAAPWYARMWVRIGLGVIIVLLILWAFMRRRNTGGKHGKPSVADHFSDSPLGPTAGAGAAALDDEEGGAYAPVADEDGEHELLAQLAEHPDDVGLHLELVSLYYARGDADQFEAAAEAMHAYVDDENQPEWQDVLIMGRELAPDHPLFMAPPLEESAPASFVDTPHEAFDDTTEDTYAPAVVDDASDSRNSDYNFDFDPVSSHGSEAGADETNASAAGLPDESEFDALPPLSSDADASSLQDESLDMSELSSEGTSYNLADELSTDAADDFAKPGFSDDPVDTKLDLARAYIDMGDHEGARAMLQEALHEGSQMQKEAAQKLLDELD